MKQRWTDYMEQLLNIENDWNSFDGEDVYEGSEMLIMEAEVLTAIRWLKCNKAGGPTGFVGDTFKAAGSAGVKAMTVLCNQVLFGGNIPTDWELSILVPVYKGKVTH